MKIIKIADHDYNPNWNYDVVKADKEIQQITQEIIKYISSNLLPKLNIPNIDVHFVKNINRLGKYISGTYSKPVVILDINKIQDGMKQYNVDIKTAIETTIVHELGHAIQEKFNIPPNEEQPEALAYQWHYNREVPNWILKYINKNK